MQALQESLQQLAEQVQQLSKARALASRGSDGFFWYGTLALASASSAAAYMYWRRSHR